MERGEYRQLSKTEIQVLESRNCYADDWSKILVKDPFDADRLYGVIFHGEAKLGRLDGRVKTETGRSRRAEEGYYLRGLAYLKLKNRKGAKADFSHAVGRTRNKEIRSHSLNALGDIAWDEDDMDQAAKCYAKSLESTKRGKKPADHSHYRLGCVFQRQGKWPDADVQFSQLDYFFRGSDLAMRAARRINCRAWTVQAGVFAEKAGANAVVKELRGKNLAAMVEPLLGREKLVFIVQVGRYAAYEQAIETLKSVRQQVDDAFVVTTR